MKKRELKKRIEDGFSELSPDLFEAVLAKSSKQGIVWAQAESEEVSGNGKFYMGRFPRYALSLCATLAVVFLCIFGVLGEEEKSVYMVLDINPSIQIEMNEEHQVERLKGLNQDGKDVVKELRWRRKESVQELLDVIIQDVVEKSYLCENGGILVTLTARDKYSCEKLERTLGEGIDRKLTELKVSGVTTAFQEVPGRNEKQGRKRLEAELKKSCGMDENQVQQMSVIELIQYCQDYTSLELKFSEASEKERAAQQKGGDKSQPESSPAAEDESGKISEDNASESVDKEPEKDGSETKGSEKKPSQKPDGTRQELKEEKQSEEGNTDSQETESQNSPVGSKDSEQAGGSLPSDSSGLVGKPGMAEALPPGDKGQPSEENVPKKPEDIGQPSEGNVLGQPGGDKAEQGNIPGQPGGGEQPDSGDVPNQPGGGEGTASGDGGQPETGNVPDQPGGGEQPEPGDAPNQAGTGEQPESEDGTGQPGTGEQPESEDNLEQPEKE